MTVNDMSFDPSDPYFQVPGGDVGVRWSVQVFTTGNVYALDAGRSTVEGDVRRLVLRGDRLRWAGQQQVSPGRVEVTVTRDGELLTWQVHAEHAEPVKSVKLLLRGLPERALAAGWWHATIPAGERHVAGYKQPVRYSYPGGLDWTTPWAAATTLTEGVCVSVRDPKVRAKRLYAHTPPWAGGDTVVEVICEDDARDVDGEFTTPQTRVRLCAGAAAAAADFADHHRWVAAAYGIGNWADRPDVPAWARETRLVVNVHGQHWTGFVFNTFDRMADTLRFVTEHIPGPQVLAYLPGWEGRYYWQYPHFQPAAALGGPEGFARLAATADELGVRLMPMFGAHGANCQVYPEWEAAAFRNPTDRYTVLVNKPDWDGDRAGEDDQVFLNTGEPRFRKHLVDQVDELVTRYRLQVAFFDTSAAWFNDPRHNLYEGYLALKAELTERHPGLLLAGEGWFDALLAVFPLNLSWLGATRRYRFPELLTDHGRAVQHILEGAPGTGSTGVFEGGFTPADRQPPTPGHLPSISFVHDTLPANADEVAALCRAARG